VLPTEKGLVVSFWRFFQVSGLPRRIRKPKPPKMFVDAGVWEIGSLSKVKLDIVLL